MKKTVFSLLLLGAVFAFLSCDDVIYDWATASLYVTITDADGSNLLDPSSPGYLLADGDALLSFPEGDHRGPSIVRSHASDSSSATRAYVGPWVGALVKNNPKGEPSIFIGEFNEGTDTELTLTFADGSDVVISVYHCARIAIGTPRLRTKASVVSAPKGWKVKADLSTQNVAGKDDIIYTDH